MTQTKPTWWLLCLTLAAASAGCLHEVSTGGCSSVLGRPSDVKTAPGDYDGYQVIKNCPVSQAQFAVRGLASWTADRRSAYQVCAAVDIPGTYFPCAGTGHACTTEGAVISVFDWGAVDSVIEHLGRLLKDDNSYREIAILVAPSPCE